ncbi:MAG: aminoglycoside phosphotransferase family protein [Christensenellaceae bacterium]|jgi:hypothetical protein|nr:aminoglycoside phosphotransferase family protein [Christensenellaceae bacterium]
MENIKEILSFFRIEGEIVDIQPYGNGHINNTYKAIVVNNSEEESYILQRINENVFKDIKALMTNIEFITAHILKKTLEDGGSEKDCLKIIRTRTDENFYACETGNYRCYNFISSGISIESIPTNELLKISGKGFGRFQRYLGDFSADLLTETIPNFHNTQDRLEKLRAAVAANVAGRYELVKNEVNFYEDRIMYGTLISEELKSGNIPLRVTHNDTKLNNILIDVDHSRPVAVIDLDTVMPSTLLYDYGDAIRYGSNIGAEDERDLSLVGFSFEAFKSFTNGFLSEVAPILSPIEIEYMASAAIVMTYECGIRFLTDYLNGDKYFKVHREHHNLDRARTQMQLLYEMEDDLDNMRKFISDYITSSDLS